MRTSQDTDKISAALAKAQAALTNPKRNREVTVTPRSGSEYKYSYATLDSIFDLIRPAMTSSELVIWQGVQPKGDNAYWLTTRIFHSSGQWIETDTPLPYSGSTDAQSLGSALSYAKRYGLTAALGIASEEDDDGKLATKGKKEGVHRPADGAGERLGELERNRMVDVATVVQDFAKQGKFDEALREWEGTDFKDNADAKVFAWDRLPAPTRSTLKRMAREKAAAQ